jgi:outer membrane biogenesis lipoprotein LolB
MKTRFGLPHLAGWTGRCGVALLALTFCASALADPSKNVVATPKFEASKMQTATQQVAKKQYYIFTGGSAIPQPIDRVSGPIPTTAIPMIVLGNFSGE